MLLIKLIFTTLLLGGVSVVSAQTENTSSANKSILDTIPEDAKALFNSYVKKPDAKADSVIRKYTKDKFIKRISIHTNAVDWAMLLPNLGLELDLKDTPRNNYSLALFGKFNGRSMHGKFIFNVNAVRIEGRKYWRTGKYGKAKEYYDSFERLYTNPKDVRYNADSLAGTSYYVDSLRARIIEYGITTDEYGNRFQSLRDTTGMTQGEIDSLDFADDSLGIKKSKFIKWYYNTYHKVRRNVISGRTLDNPRNWRAYYIGVWAGVDNWSISFTGKGNQGNGLGAGLVAGYTLPLYSQKYPREGSLDLDFGLAAGWKAVKYDAYTYEEATQHYVYDPARSQKSWKIVPYPIIQDIHVSLVWRFRGIKHKVDRSLIDDYKKQVSRFNERINARDSKHRKIADRRAEIIKAITHRTHIMADSAEVWGGFHRRRLEAAMKIKPDTMFVDRDQELYLFLFKGISKENQEKYIDQLLDNQKKADKENQKEEARKQKELEKEEKKKVKGQKKQKKSKDKDTIDNVVPIIEPVEKIDSVGIDKTEIVPPKEVETNDSTAISQQLVISCLIERKKNRI
jgi:hypothetical protein